jgi:predicted enzyme related to lactoylglutathione lyase
MVKLYVGDLAAAEKFYGAVFGAKPALAVGERAHIVTLPKGGPGLVLLKEGRDDKQKYGAFIIQVPDLRVAQARAVANGAKVQGKFAGAPANQIAKSVDLLDPWGNQVEILQIG